MATDPKTAKVELATVEPYLPGTYEKYSNNWGYVNDDSNYAHETKCTQAFSHYTFERTKGQIMAADMQGVGLILTDPCILTASGDMFTKLRGNVGFDGMIMFFISHSCNSICMRLGLKSKASDMQEGRFNYRSDWIFNSTSSQAICSNKLCNQLISNASTKINSSGVQAEHHYLWCSKCTLELTKQKEKDMICVHDGCGKKFKYSPFFCEAQMQYPPKTCLEHQ